MSRQRRAPARPRCGSSRRVNTATSRSRRSLSSAALRSTRRFAARDALADPSMNRTGVRGGGKASSQARAAGKWVQAFTTTSIRSPVRLASNIPASAARHRPPGRWARRAACRFRQLYQLSLSRGAGRVQSVAKREGEVVDIGLTYGSRRSQARRSRAWRWQLRGGLDRGHGADHGQVERGAHRRAARSSRRYCTRSPPAAGDTAPPAARAARAPAPQSPSSVSRAVGESRRSRRRRPGARSGQQRAGRRDHRQAPDPRVEEQDRSIVGRSSAPAPNLSAGCRASTATVARAAAPSWDDPQVKC